ncbi:uncharacterized protein QC761_109920 [Podospora bellae-mahoneyi]|uniref:3-beta hydroxysteroid dehydrogenase/isomerase domain-containing protein n=1 Tax=Podospora bellae-mahoneyi TaxID=2093777 RepID=A0ABR0FWW8_9PEZI|nr:hypothetical protein QC761_109920 [Podospora bellae-mahoneyi]
MLILALVALGVFWLYRFNSALRSTPEEARKFSPKRWTKEQVKEAYENVKKNPVNFLKHVPPAQERRYIIVGGSGLVGGDIVLQLLERGQSPSSIRILDFAPITRDDMLPKTSACDFVQTDITSIPSVEAAFSKPWPPLRLPPPPHGLPHRSRDPPPRTSPPPLLPRQPRQPRRRHHRPQHSQKATPQLRHLHRHLFRFSEYNPHPLHPNLALAVPSRRLLPALQRIRL